MVKISDLIRFEDKNNYPNYTNITYTNKGIVNIDSVFTTKDKVSANLLLDIYDWIFTKWPTVKNNNVGLSSGGIFIFF